ncbi:MAG: hypothetical protein M3392_02160 [Actinomycetota bacterium]|nr:hypothetical protein [Actinomycetota bacterium]
MIARAKRSWRNFKKSKPGDRFQVRYYYRKQRGTGRLSRIFNVFLGSVLVIMSTLFGWAPGLGLVTLLIGLALIAGELFPVARFLDWSEVKLRKLARLAGKIWAGVPLVGRTLIVLLVLVLVAALVYGAYSLLFGA